MGLCGTFDGIVAEEGVVGKGEGGDLGGVPSPQSSPKTGEGGRGDGLPLSREQEGTGFFVAEPPQNDRLGRGGFETRPYG